MTNPKSRRFVFVDARGEVTDGYNIRELVTLMLSRGVAVTIMMLHEDNAALPELLRQRPGSPADLEEILDGVRREIAYSEELWKRTASGAQAAIRTAVPTADMTGSFRLVKVLKGMLPQRVTMTEAFVLTTPFSYVIGANGNIPAMFEPSETSWYDYIKGEMQFLALANSETTWVPVAPAARAVEKVATIGPASRNQ
jgi:hypothetical protein